MARVPFFVTGIGRSGSTYLYHLLRAHPKIAITNEARLIDALWLAYQVVSIPYGQKVPDSDVVGVVAPETKPVIEQVFLGHLMGILEEYYLRSFPPGFTHFGDKLPDYCAVAAAAKWCDSIKALLMVRDPRDVVCSYRAFRRTVPLMGAREVKMQGYSAEDFARIWRDTYEVLLRDVSHIHRVSYADLVEDPAATVRRALDFLGLPFDRAVSDAIVTNDTAAPHGTSRSARESIGRWHQDLPAEDARLVEAICGPTMAKLGLAI